MVCPLFLRHCADPEDIEVGDKAKGGIKSPLDAFWNSAPCTGRSALQNLNSLYDKWGELEAWLSALHKKQDGLREVQDGPGEAQEGPPGQKRESSVSFQP